MPKVQSTSIPGWVKAFLWAGLLAIIAVGVMLASGHGPWEHMNMAGMH